MQQLLAAEPSSVPPAGSEPTPLPVALAPGAEAVVQEAVSTVAQARHRSLLADAQGALNILKKLEALPTLREYRALKAALHEDTCRALVFLTQQSAGLGLAYQWGTGFVIARCTGDSRKPCWSAPCYVRIRGVALGLIAGYEYVQSVLFIHSTRVLERFTHGALQLGLGLTVMAGSEMLRDLAANPDQLDDVGLGAPVQFSLAAGVMVNGSVQVSMTTPDRRMNRQLFGDLTLCGTRDVTAQQVLEGAVPPPEEFAELYRYLDRLAVRRPWA